MVVIRLARGGAKKNPFYRVVVADQRQTPRGRFIEQLGFYNPTAQGNEETLRLDGERVTHWVEKGAQMSPRVKKLVSQAQKA